MKEVRDIGSEMGDFAALDASPLPGMVASFVVVHCEVFSAKRETKTMGVGSQNGQEERLIFLL